jgi:prepilin peptidase CpaA
MAVEYPVLLVASVAGYFDARWHRVPNWLTATALALSLGWHAWSAGLDGLVRSAAGAALGTALLFPLFLLRAMGAGDVKFCGALGAALTYRHVLPLLLLSLLAGGALAAWLVARRGAAGSTAQNLAELAGSALAGRIAPHPVVHIDNPHALVVPFTFAQSIATWAFVLANWGSLA